MLELWVANLPPGVTEERLRDVFAPLGEVHRISVSERAQAGLQAWKAQVSLDTEEEVKVVLSRVLGTVLDDRRLFVSLFEPAPANKLKKDQQDLAQHLADTLGETELRVQNLLRRLVQICGVDFCRMALEEAQAILAAGGLPVTDGSRQRTAGGVFFYLIKDLVSTPTRRAIFGEPQLPKRERAQDKKEGENAGPVSAPAQTDGAPKQPKKGQPVAHAASAQEIADLSQVRQQLVALREARQVAQQRLELIKTGKATQAGGMFSAIKEVLDLQRQIENVLNQYPELN